MPKRSTWMRAGAMPAWIGRFGHAALCGHFLLLVGLGLYLRLVARPTPGLWLAGLALQVAALLVHPYLAAMTLALLGAVPLCQVRVLECDLSALSSVASLDT